MVVITSMCLIATPMFRHLDLDLQDAAHLQVHVCLITLNYHWFACYPAVYALNRDTDVCYKLIKIVEFNCFMHINLIH